MNIIKLSLSTLLILTTFSGCHDTAELTPSQKTKLYQFNVTQLDKLKNDINQAINQDELLLYAPVSIEDSRDYYEDALDADIKEKKLAAYLASKKALAHGYETKKLVFKYLSDIMKIDEKMQKQHTKDIYEDRYDDFINDYKDLITLIDKDKVSDALEDKKELLVDAKNLYGDIVVYRNINKAKIVLEQLEDDDLNKLVPKHFEEAKKIYESTRLSIKKEPDNKEMIKELSKKTNDLALYTKVLADEVKTLEELSKDEKEAYFDKLHRRIAKLYRAHHESILPLSMFYKIERLETICR